MSDRPIGAVEFLRGVQRILSEGLFTSTYKFALLQALSDICVERKLESSGRLTICLHEIALKFLEYYWRQSKPIVGGESLEGFVVQQNAGQQSSVIKKLVQAQRDGYSTFVSFRSSHHWEPTLRKIITTIKRQPLFRLQLVSGEYDNFLYHHEIRENAVTLKFGCQKAFRAFHPLLKGLLQSSWLSLVESFPRNYEILGDAGRLRAHLFGVPRGSLDAYRRIAYEVYDSRCFYCEHIVNTNAVADHFVPWARFPTDIGENLVLAHASCNRRKRDYLAAEDHLRKWMRFVTDKRDEISGLLRESNLITDLGRAKNIAYWAYEEQEKSNAKVWLKENEFENLRGKWRALIT